MSVVKPPRSFKVLAAHVCGPESVAAGDTVYALQGHDYGCAADDTRILGKPHVAVTKQTDGGYPFFILPKEILEEVK